jgi:DNA-binding NarL/FixJ family response regulator
VTTVLLVDDQALFRMGLRMVIDAEPELSVVGEASDGEQAVTAVARLRPDVVLMDVRMPGTDGIAATERIVAAYPDSRVVILTTFDLDQYVLDGVRAGASGFLLKDAAPNQLLDAIRTVARGDAVLAPTAIRRLLDRFAQPPARAAAADTPRRPPRPELLDALTEREREVFLLMARGLSNREIAGELYLSEHTVKIHVARVLTKLEVRDRVQAVVLGYESGLLPDAPT